jgi:HTH-type transcriptional regulator, sugar sensing transcriptional regulator
MYEKLIQLGLTSTEAKIYVALIEYGRLQAGIISRKTGIHRRSVYDSLERLIEKGLVSWIKENDKRYYYAESPDKLLDIVDIQKKVVNGILPELHIKFEEKKEKQETKFYKGVEGIKSIFEDQIDTGKPVYIIGASYDASKILKYYMPHYTSTRVKKKLKLYLIYAGGQREFAIPYGETAYLPESYASPVSTNIYGDKVAIVVWSEEPVAILIKNKTVADTYKKYFDVLWKMAKKKKEKHSKIQKTFEV